MKYERASQNDIFLRIGSRPDCRLFRNTIGMAVKASGEKIKFGLCNPGGSDLIGWTRIKITPEMVGRTMAVFTAIESKRPGWKPNQKWDLGSQNNFIGQVLAAGGLAGVARNVEEAKKIIERGPGKLYIF